MSQAITDGRLGLDYNPIIEINSEFMRNLGCGEMSFTNTKINRINWSNKVNCSDNNQVFLKIYFTENPTTYVCFNHNEEALKKELKIRTNNSKNDWLLNYFDTISNKWVLPSVILVPNCTDTTIIGESYIQQGIQKSDSLVLVNIYNSNPSNTLGWDLTKPMNTWSKVDASSPKVKIENNRVTELVMNNANISVLPAQIGNLKKLERLIMSENKLSSLPSEFSQLESLNNLNLTLNSFIDFPNEILELNNLEKLNLSKNQLASIPDSISKLQKLETLSLFENSINSLPKSIGSLKKLRDLIVGFNNLNAVPVEIEQLDSLTSIDLSSNQFNTFPLSVTKLKNLIGLSISSNQITTIPNEIGNLKEMLDLQIHNNKLTSLPASIGDMPKLLTLEAEENLLTEFPTELVLKILNHNNTAGINLSYNLIENFPDNKDILDLHLGKKTPTNMALNNNNIKVLNSIFFNNLQCDSVTFKFQNIGRINLGNTNHCSSSFWNLNIIDNKKDSLFVCYNGSFEGLKDSIKINLNNKLNHYNTISKKWVLPNVRLIPNCSDSSEIIYNVSPIIVLKNDSAERNQNKLIDLTDNISDQNGDILFLKILETTYGSSIIKEGLKLEFTPKNNFTGTDIIRYEVCDKIGACDTSEVIITVNRTTNKSPVVSEIYASTKQNNSVNINLLTNANDADGDSMIVSVNILANPKGSFVKQTNPLYINYTPNKCFFGKDSLQYIVCDTFNLCDTSFIIINVSQNYSLPNYTIKGHVFSDINKNSKFDIGEEIRGVRINNNQNYGAYSNSDGSYKIYTRECEINNIFASPTYKRVCNGNDYVRVTSMDSVRTFNTDSNITGVNFRMSIPEDPCKTVSGIIFSDKNKNGIQDVGEFKLLNTKILLNDSKYIYTNYKGEYSLDVKKGEVINLKPIYNKINYVCGSTTSKYEITLPVSGSYTRTVIDNIDNLNFGILPEEIEHNIEVATIRMSGGVYPGKSFKGWMDYHITGEVPTDCKLKLTHDPKYTFEGAEFPVALENSTSIIWDVPSKALRTGKCMGMNFRISPTAVINQEMVWNAEFTCPDLCPEDDKLTRTFTVRGNQSNFKKAVEDANTMVVYHGDSIKPFITHNDSVFSYEIDFKNTTGHNAVHMAIIDTLSEHLDITSLSSPFSSQPYRLFIKDGNILHFEFENINLPDATNDELNSYGFVQFNIKMKPNLPLNTDIENKASIIYNYEYNSPISIKRVNSKLGIPTGINDVSSELSFGVYPNPSSGIFTIETDEKEITIEVFNSIGQLLFTKQNTTIIDLSKYSAGIYNLRVNGSSQLVVKQ